jgi:DNA processing protein
MSSDGIYRTNFPKRNRIIAGLSDATLVVEAAEKGGALITANIADSYNRDVFAIPGKITDKYSRGCNNLIRTNKAAMITSAKDIVYLMGWEKDKTAKYKQSSLAIALNDEQKIIVELLKKNDNARIDWLANYSGIKMNKVAVLLLDLEFMGMVKTLPGKVYCLV